MPAHAAVSVHDDLATCEAGIALWPTDYEPPCGIDQELGLFREQIRRQLFANHFADQEVLDLAMLHVLGMLRRYDDVRDPDDVVTLVNDGDLRFRIGSEPRYLAALTDPRQCPSEPMCVHDRRRHQFRRFIARVSEHQALVACALL